MARMSADRRREAIVDSALAVARRKGLAATTVRDVAAEMGTSSGLVHHYFETMDDVLAAAFERVAGDELAETDAILAEAGDPLAVIAAFLGSYAPVGEDWSFQLWLDAWAEAGRRPALREASGRLNLGWAAMLERAIRDGVRAGVFRSDRPRGRGVADSVRDRRARASDRRPSNDHRPLGHARLGDGERRARARAGAGRPCRQLRRSAPATTSVATAIAAPTRNASHVRYRGPSSRCRRRSTRRRTSRNATASDSARSRFVNICGRTTREVRMKSRFVSWAAW